MLAHDTCAESEKCIITVVMTEVINAYMIGI